MIEITSESMPIYPKGDGDSKMMLMEQGGQRKIKQDVEQHLMLGMDDSKHYESPLPCFGCGIGWFSFVFGFVFPLAWYFASVLYFRRYHLKDPRERAGLAASAVAALICSLVALLVVLVLTL